jgi:hypothetical protein
MTTTRVTPEPRTQLHDTRYGELLFGTLEGDTVRAEVWTTFTLNDCPAEQWDPIVVDELAKQRGATFGLKNGPRYWLIDELLRAPVVEDIEFGRFEALDMVRVASVRIDVASIASREYRESKVDRRTLFTWKAGRRVYELVDPEGGTYVMQAYSQIVDPSLREADLGDLGSRLLLPEGWRYGSRILDADLLVDTRTVEARVLQDELQNSYCRRD